MGVTGKDRKIRVGLGDQEITSPGRLSMDECREQGCTNLSTTAGYCRAHYIKNWRAVKRKEALLKDGSFRRYVEELIAKYPDAVIRAVRHDLASDEAFEKARLDLDLHEGDEDVASLDSDFEGPERKAG